MDLSHDHSRTIIHIDIDCFYAQVEMLKDPSRADKPLAVKQKSIVVTSNYNARSYGLLKGMSIVEARRLCPDLVIVNGEDLHDYRQISYKITEYLQTISPKVERLGLDENYIDVTELVNKKVDLELNYDDVGTIFGSPIDHCLCGCYSRIKLGSVIAKDIRDRIFSKFKLTTCAGIAHNKLLAKLVGAKNRPNQQTLLLPESALELVSSLNAVDELTAIGRTTVDKLHSINVRSIVDLQQCTETLLQATLGKEKATFVQEISNGIDTSSVKLSGKPVSIGLEDSLYQNHYTAETQVRGKLDQLLRRLMLLVSEDGRIPRTVKLTVRKQLQNNNNNNNFDQQKVVSGWGVRETRQCAISPGLFAVKDGGVVCLKDAHAHGKVVGLVMGLFAKVVDVKREFHVTLLGLSFTKFQERGRLSTPSLPSLLLRSNSSLYNTSSPTPTSTTAPISPTISSVSALTRRPSRSVSPLRSFFSRTGGPVEVQSLTNIENRSTLPELTQSTSGHHRAITGETTCCETSLTMDCTTGSNSSNASELCGFNTDGSESEVEPPSPKRTKFIGIIAKRRCGATITNPGDDCPSPSKLRYFWPLKTDDGEKRSHDDFRLSAVTSSMASSRSGSALPVELMKKLRSHSLFNKTTVVTLYKQKCYIRN